ncbi:MAG: MBOAT family protein [Victivallales bacterium]|nr:MBOAT family protein [Victivallales bacterium]
MALTSFAFLGFIALLALVFYRTKSDRRWLVLLVGSIIFYLSISPFGAIVLILNAFVAYRTALGIQKLNDDFAQQSSTLSKEERREAKSKLENRCTKCLFPAIAVALLSLLLFKYYNQALWQGGLYATLLQSQHTMPEAELEQTAAQIYNALLPLGISYFTLTLISYVLDVSRELVPAEKNPLKVLLFGSCFLHIMQGPFSRYGQIMPQLENTGNCSIGRIKSASLRIAWGYLKKLCIADQMAIIANEAFDNCTAYSGLALWTGLLCFAVQLYADFSGYMDIILGSGELFGLRLPENFRQPFFARSMSDFWKRWHITLGLWLQDYVFYPLQKSKRMKSWFGKGQGIAIFSLLLTWLVIGFWHGSAMHFVFSVGFLQFIYVMAERKLLPQPTSNDRLPTRILQGLRCTLLMLFAWIFFRAASLYDGWNYLCRMFTFKALNAQLYQFNSLLCDISIKQLCTPLAIRCLYFLACIILLLAVDIVHEKGISIRSSFNKLHWFWQMAILMVIAFTFIVFGSYGAQYKAGNFLYMAF